MARIGEFIEVDGRRVHVLDEGRGAPVLLLHGCGSLAEETLAAFSDRCEGVRLLAVDRPGYGGSDPLPADQAGPDGQADWLARAMDALGLDRAVVAGHSYGAATALFLAAQHPARVGGLMLIAPFCRPTPHAAMPLLHLAVAPLIGNFIRRAVIAPLGPIIGPGRMAAAHRPNPVPEYLASFPYDLATTPVAVTTMAAELLAFNRATMALAAAAGAITMPVTLMTGAMDEIAPPDWHARWISDLVPGAEVIALDGSGHAPHHVDPDRATAALVRLVRRATRPSPDGTAADRHRPSAERFHSPELEDIPGA